MSSLCHADLEKQGKELSCHPSTQVPTFWGLSFAFTCTAFLQGDREEDMGKPSFWWFRAPPPPNIKCAKEGRGHLWKCQPRLGEEAGAAAPFQDTQALGHIWAGRASGHQRACPPALLIRKAHPAAESRAHDHPLTGE